MNTEDLLRHQGRTWQSPTVGAPDLTAALARRARRTRALAGSLTALVLLAGAGTWAVWTHPVGGSVAAVPSTGPTSDAEIADLIARDLAAVGSNGDEVTVTGEAVRTTAAAAVAAFDSSLGLAPDAGVWVVQLRGAFGDDAPDAIAHPWLIGIVDAAAPTSSIQLYREQPHDLSALGVPFAIEPFHLAGRTIDRLDDDAPLTSTVRAALARSTTSSLTLASAVRTTREEATATLLGQPPAEPGEVSVWLVELQGQFDCPDCTPLDPAGAHRGTVLSMVVATESGELAMMTISDRARGLNDLGGVLYWDEPSVLLK
jgi:hypothetical protein